MGDRYYKGTIETLGDLRDHGMGLYAHCNAPDAGHGRRLNLDKLIQLFGADYVYINDQEIGRRAICTECGHVGAKINLIADTTPPGWKN